MNKQLEARIDEVIKNKSKTGWSEEQIEIFKKLLDGGCTLREILDSEMLPFTYNQLKHKKTIVWM